jgi:hypothetical protein
MIKPDYLNGWTYRPEFTTADTSSFESNIHINDSAEAIADAIDRRIHHIYNEREANMVSIKFNDLEKELKELGIELSTIRQSSGEVGCEIAGYFTPSVYKAHNAREKLTPVHPVGPKPIPKKVKFSGPATIILWEDGTKTVVKCQKEDVWDNDVGIAMCYLKKMLGNKGNFNNIFREAMKVAEVQYKKEDLNATKTVEIEGDNYYSSALECMKQNIDEINDFMKDAAEALDKALGGKK